MDELQKTSSFKEILFLTERFLSYVS